MGATHSNLRADYDTSPMGRETVLAPVVWEEGKSQILFKSTPLLTHHTLIGRFPVVNGAVPGHAYIKMKGPLPPTRTVCIPSK